MGILQKIWPKKDIHGKNLGKEFKKISLNHLDYADPLQTKYLCPVCKKGSIELRDCQTKGTCILCGQSFLFKQVK